MIFGARPTVGLDIGSRFVKAVQLRRSGKNIELDAFGLTEIHPVGQKPQSEAEFRQAKVEAIRRVLAEAGIKNRQVITAVRGESIIVRYLQLPEMRGDELKNALHWEAQEHIPFRIEDVNIDWSVIGRTVEGTNRKLDILLVCAQKEVINQHVALLKEAGLTPQMIDLDSFAFLNCFQLNHQPGPNDVVGLLNIGGETTSISIFSGGHPRFSRDISIGGNAITEAIHQRLEVPFAEAEAIKLRRGVQPARKEPESRASQGEDFANNIRASLGSSVAEPLPQEGQDQLADRAILNTLSNLTSEIRRSLRFFEGQAHDGQHVGKLVIGGGASRLDGLDSLIQQELDLPVETIDPLRRIPVTGNRINTHLLRDNTHTLSVGIGLALRKVVD